MKRLTRSMILGLVGILGVAAAPAAEAQSFLDGFKIGLSKRGVQVSINRRGTCRPVRHYHQWAVQSRRSWQPAQYRTVLAGYKRCGTPIYQQVLVRAASWQVNRVKVCGCGARIRI